MKRLSSSLRLPLRPLPLQPQPLLALPLAARALHTRSLLSAPTPSRHTHAPAAAASSSIAYAVDDTPAYPSPVGDSAEAEQQPAYVKPNKRTWHLFDARDQVVGRLAGRIATLLMGKHKPDYTPSLDNGDVVVVLNAQYLQFTGKKWEQKLYRYHTGYPGGLREIPAERWRHSHPERILKHAVAGMIRKNKLKVPRLARLKIYPGLLHPHQAQFPFDVIEQVPHLKAQREKEREEEVNRKAREQDAIHLAATSGKQQKAKPAPPQKQKGDERQVVDDSVTPEDPEIRTAILKDREARQGKPIVRL